VIYDPTDSGFCVSDSLQFLGIPHTRKAWMSIPDVSSLTKDFIVVKGKNIVRSPLTKIGYHLTLDIQSKHAYISKFKDGYQKTY